MPNAVFVGNFRRLKYYSTSWVFIGHLFRYSVYSPCILPFSLLFCSNPLEALRVRTRVALSSFDVSWKVKGSFKLLFEYMFLPFITCFYLCFLFSFVYSDANLSAMFVVVFCVSTTSSLRSL